MSKKGAYYAGWRDGMRDASRRAAEAQEECAKDPSAFFDRLARLSREEDARVVLERWKLSIEPAVLLDLWERWTASCVRLKELRPNNIVRACPCEDCVSLVEECRRVLGTRWRAILQSDTLSMQEGLLHRRDRAWKSERQHPRSKPPEHRRGISEAWVIRRLHARLLGVSPQDVDKEGNVLQRLDGRAPRPYVGPSDPEKARRSPRYHQKNSQGSDGEK